MIGPADPVSGGVKSVAEDAPVFVISVAAELAGHDPARVVQRRDEALLHLLRLKAAQGLP